MPLLPRWTLLFLTIIFLVGCEKVIDFRQKRLQNAQSHISQIRNRTVPDDKIHTLHWCIETALAQNLDLKAAELQQAVMNERTTAAVMGMLPDLNLNYRSGSRSNEPGSRSESITTGIQTLEPSKSSEKEESRFNMELMFGILDFGLSYYNSIHESDKALLEAKQRRRTTQNLILDVAKAYFRVASIQYEMSTIKDLIDRSEKAEALIDDLRTSKRIEPLEALTKIKALKKLKQRLTEYRRSYENACINLSSLMGFAPVNELRVDTSLLETLQIVEIPEVEVLEQIALDERPELFQLDIESHITAVEARKSLLMMFPNVRLFANFTNSSNKFLYNQSWWDIALGSVYNLLKLPSEIYNYNALEIQLKEIATQTMALSIGIMAQVRIAHANLIEVKSRYELSEELFSIDQQRLEAARPRAQAGGSLSSLDLLKYELETAETFFERTQSLSNYYLAYYRLLNAVGLESLDEQVTRRARTILPEMEAAQFVKAEPVNYQQNTSFDFMLDNINHEIFSSVKATSPRSHKSSYEGMATKQITHEDRSSAWAASEKPMTPNYTEPPVQASQQTSTFDFMLDNIEHETSEDTTKQITHENRSSAWAASEKSMTPDYTEPPVQASQQTSTFDFMLDNIEHEISEDAEMPITGENSPQSPSIAASEKSMPQAQASAVPPAQSVQPISAFSLMLNNIKHDISGNTESAATQFKPNQSKNIAEKNIAPVKQNVNPSYASPAFQLMLDQIVKGM